METEGTGPRLHVVKKLLLVGGLVLALIAPASAQGWSALPDRAKLRAAEGAVTLSGTILNALRGEPHEVATEGDPVHRAYNISITGRIGHCPLVAVGLWRCVLHIRYSWSETSGDQTYQSPKRHCPAPMVASRRWWRFPAGEFRCPPQFRP